MKGPSSSEVVDLVPSKERVTRKSGFGEVKKEAMVRCCCAAAAPVTRFFNGAIQTISSLMLPG
jgi:hypothetical protein